MSFAEQLREIVEEHRPIIEKKHEEMRLAKEKLFEKLSKLYLEDIHSSITTAKKNGKNKKLMNQNREDFKINIAGADKPIDLLREWINEIKNPNSRFLIESKTGKNLCLEGIDIFVWNNRNLTTEFSWVSKGCPHNGRECNCFGLNKTSSNMNDKLSFNGYKRMNYVISM